MVLTGLLNGLEFIVSGRVILVGGPDVIHHNRDAACLEHAHHHGRARAWQTRHDGYKVFAFARHTCSPALPETNWTVADHSKNKGGGNSSKKRRHETAYYDFHL